MKNSALYNSGYHAGAFDAVNCLPAEGYTDTSDHFELGYMDGFRYFNNNGVFVYCASVHDDSGGSATRLFQNYQSAKDFVDTCESAYGEHWVITKTPVYD